MVILANAGLPEHLNQQNSWVVYHYSVTNITYNIFPEPNRKEPPRPKPRLTTMGEVDSDYDPMGASNDKKEGMSNGDFCYSNYVTLTK